MTTRADVLLESVDRSASIIEIGPNYAPIAPKAGGWNTKTVDIASKPELLERFRDHGLDLDKIEDVDFPWRAGPLCAAVPSEFHGTFDVLVAKLANGARRGAPPTTQRTRCTALKTAPGRDRRG